MLLGFQSFAAFVHCRYASLYFCMCVDAEDNELETLEVIHHYVEILDRYFTNVRGLIMVTYLALSENIFTHDNIFARLQTSIFTGLLLEAIVIPCCSAKMLQFDEAVVPCLSVAWQVCELDLIFNFHKVCSISRACIDVNQH